MSNVLSVFRNMENLSGGAFIINQFILIALGGVPDLPWSKPEGFEFGDCLN